MNEAIRLTAEERKAAMAAYQTSADGARRIRAHVLLLLDDGHGVEMTQLVTFTTAGEVAEVLRLFRQGGVDTVLAG